MKFRSTTIIFSLSLLLFYSCKQQESEYLLSESTYKDVFIELAIVNHMDTLLLSNVTREELIQQIFDHYEVTPEEFSRTHDTFEKDIDQQVKRMEEILVILREERNRIDQIEQDFNRLQRESADSLRQRLLSR